MQPTPPYRSEDLRAAYHLRYGWTGWTSGGEPSPAVLSNTFLADLAPLWEPDGLRLLESNCRVDQIQCTFSAKPSVSPVLLAGRAKGRLQHALRTHGTPVKFSRKVAVRSIGENRTNAVQQYIEQQVGKELLADERFRDQLEEFTVVDPDVDLSQPTASNSGRHWYNLHLVLVVRDRGRVNDLSQLAAIRDCSPRIAEKKGYRIFAVVSSAGSCARRPCEGTSSIRLRRSRWRFSTTWRSASGKTRFGSMVITSGRSANTTSTRCGNSPAELVHPPDEPAGALKTRL